MRTHGWNGAPPSTDEEAVARIIAATHRCVQQRGGQTTIAHVASELGVSRATVYRYFPSTSAMLMAAAQDGTRRFVEKLGARLRSVDDISEAVIEGIVHTVTNIADEPYLQVLLNEPTHTLLRGMTSDSARRIAHSVLVDNTAIDWTETFSATGSFDELIEWALRVVQSFMYDSDAPPRDAEDLRDYLRRWLAPAIRAQTGSVSG
ncbi:TetR/AcrR family transcriptional regulator [Nocardia sp. NPDC052254]|uniref:TetR/AcrR family transcriptional regulator n=1 Tax=Nocardia sp. NPDC052254 TaxID=3155681 RepID=UPI003432E284